MFFSLSILTNKYSKTRLRHSSRNQLEKTSQVEKHEIQTNKQQQQQKKTVWKNWGKTNKQIA